jgi:hypothetical protein
VEEMKRTFEATIIQLPDGEDESVQKVLRFSDGKTLEFAESNDELWLHSWHCEGQGKNALKIMENYAKERSMKIIVPTILNVKLMMILLNNGYTYETRYEPIVEEYLDLMVKNHE